MTSARTGLLPLYCALVGLGGIVAHLAAEFFSMGPDFGAVALSPRHIYLGLAAAALGWIASARLVALWRQSSGGHDMKRLLNVGLEELPARGHGAFFFAATALAQFAVGMATEIGEGSPFSGHDVAAGVIGALLTSLVLSLACAKIARTLPRIAAAVQDFLRVRQPNAALATVARREASFSAPRNIYLIARIFARPPPPLQA